MRNGNFVESLKHAADGVFYVIKTERNMKIHVVATVGVLALSAAYRIAKTELLLVCLCIGMVWGSEIINTAVETVVDMLTVTFHPKARIAKDAAAGAVLVCAVAAASIGWFIFFDRIRQTITAFMR